MSTLLPPKVITSTLARGQGLSGPAGPAGGAGFNYVAGAAVSAFRALGINESGQAVYVSCNALSDVLRLAGISLAGAAAGAGVTVQTLGLVEYSGWAWTPDQPVLLGLNGALVQAPLPVSAVFSQVVGKALSATRLLVALQPPIKL